MEKFMICPALQIYRAEGTKYKHRSLSYIRRRYRRYRDLMYDGEEYGDRIHAWQYVKAYTRILQDRHAWDYFRGAPYRW